MERLGGTGEDRFRLGRIDWVALERIDWVALERIDLDWVG